MRHNMSNFFISVTKGNSSSIPFIFFFGLSLDFSSSRKALLNMVWVSLPCTCLNTCHDPFSQYVVEHVWL